MKTCPGCGSLLADNADFCHFCNTRQKKGIARNYGHHQNRHSGGEFRNGTKYKRAGVKRRQRRPDDHH